MVNQVKYYEQLRSMIRQIRLDQGFTQRNMAEALGITRSAYTYYETGHIKLDIYTIVLISKIFSVSMEIFVSPQDYMGVQNGRQRAPTKIVDNPSSIDELTSEEKGVIAKMRANRAE